jgi:D-glycero-alpha-D-manno-heptose-7-phosphate kinase
MIISRSPLRITLGGGGTDLPSYYQHFEGELISAAINHYVFVSVMRPFKEGIFLKYSNYEHQKSIDEVEHPIIRESLNLISKNDNQIEISSFADVPAGTGLGSSSSFTTALLKALHHHHNREIAAEPLAKLAWEIELEQLNQPIGKQDQLISSLGGIRHFIFHKNGEITHQPLKLKPNTQRDLEQHLLLFFTGYTRQTNDILSEQKQRSIQFEHEILENLHKTKELGQMSKLALEQGDLMKFGQIMHHHWILKKQRSSKISNPIIDDYYTEAQKHGAIGGKLIGAGGGGFLMFLSENPEKLRLAMKKQGLKELKYSFDFKGCCLVNQP